MRCLILAAILVPLIACLDSSDVVSEGHSKEVAASKAVARVNEELISRAEYNQFLKFTRGDLSDDPSPLPERELFREFLSRKLLSMAAREKGVTVADEEVVSFVGSRTIGEDVSDPALSENVREFLVAHKYLHGVVAASCKVTVTEMQRYYEQNYTKFTVEDRAHVLEILVDQLDEAQRMQEKLASGDIRGFKREARLHSKGVTASNGGDLGVYERGDLPEEFEKAIFGLKVGEVSAPFQSSHGYHLFLLEEKIPRHPQKFFEVRTQIFKELMALKEREATEAYLQELLERADIEIYDKSLDFNLEITNSDEEGANEDS